MASMQERMQVQRDFLKSSEAAGSSAAAASSTHGPNVRFTGSFNAASRIVATEGVSGLYRGYIAHQMVWTPFNAVYFSAYEYAKSIAHRILLADKSRALGVATSSAERKDSELPSFAFPLCAAASGAFASAATAPLDLIKTRLQTQGKTGMYSGYFDCLRKVVAQGGIRAIFTGVGARCLWLAPNLAITMTLFENIKLLAAASTAASASSKASAPVAKSSSSNLS